MKKAKSFLALLLTLAMVLSLAACGGSNGDKPADNTQAAPAGTAGAETSAASAYDENAVITMGLNGSWDSLCPLASTTAISDVVASSIFDPLVKPDGKGGYAGHLAESYEFVDDNTAIVFHLRDNVKWHDGEPFDADDVIFTTHLVADGSYTTSRRLFLQNVAGCSASGVEESDGSAAVEKIDQYTVKYTLKSPMSEQGAFANIYCFFIFPEHLLADADPATILENDFWVNPVGTGAFTYESQIPGESLTVASNPDYYLGAPQYAKLVLKVLTQANILTAMMSGEVDVVNGVYCAISDTDMAMASTIPGYTVSALEGTSSHFLVVNGDTFPSTKVRRALAMLLDKDTMIQAACGGNASYVHTSYTNKNVFFDQAIVDEYGYKFDPETAIQMLKEENFDFDRTYTVCINELAVRQSMMTVMQDTWAKYGLKLEIKTLDTQTCIATIREGGCDFWVNGGNSADYTNLQLWLLDWCTVNDDGSLAPFNLARIHDTTMMNLLKELASAVDEAEVKRLTGEIQKYMLTECNYIYMIGPFINTAFSDRLEGIDYDTILGYVNWHEWKVLK